MAKAIMFQGTGSDVGKSLLVAGIARALTLRGLKVRPFKPQNMSNNAGVTADGGEIGRAQMLQAKAAMVPPSVHMNPVLLKPQSEIGSQIIVQGKLWGSARAAEYQQVKPQMLPFVLESFERLKSDADIVLVEGAGSASEVNLRTNDIANMGFAQAADIPVVLIGDIERGGVIASLVGTKAVLPSEDAALIAGFIVNKFRGDPRLFDSGMEIVRQATGWGALGLVPHFDGADRLPAEDALALDQPLRASDGTLVIAVPILPRIANFDDLDPLAAEPGVRLVRVKPGQALPGNAALVLLPGSKSTIADLQALRDAGFDIDIQAHVRRGGHVLGLCAGYQMLGRTIADPDGIEGAPGTVNGLGFLAIDTVLTGKKQTTLANGRDFGGAPINGYEIHVGETSGPDCERPFLIHGDGRPDGARSADGRIVGTYVHGLFTDDAQRAAWIGRLGGTAGGFSYDATVEAVLDGLAAHLERHLDIDGLLRLAR
ncbi:cobyric acid synthase [Lacibacterium aquatile]|uniref:Cobyric acid synthase n=1 Tax=Lacibacterium aquatile TaxID=1168082 RepID=A0ABW5DSL3_9PROT